MPSSLEVLEPSQLTFTAADISEFLSALQARLHQVDFLAKHLQSENDHLKHNLADLLKNYITILLRNNNLTSPQLSAMIGLSQEALEDFLDQLIDEGKIDLKEGIYFLKKE